MNKHLLLYIISIILTVNTVYAQKQLQKKQFKMVKIQTIDPDTMKESYNPQLTNMEAPTPGGNSYKSFVNRQKTISKSRFPANKNTTQSVNYGTAPNPIIGKQMGMYKYIAQLDSNFLLKGGTPLDNTMALGPDDVILASVNSFLWGFDLKGDTTLFMDENGTTRTISFAEFGSDYITGPNEFPFDPKLLYVHNPNTNHEGYVFVFLSGRGPSDSKIIVGFTSSDDPRDPWHVYMLPGNPRDTNQWTDFPMIGYDENHLFITINLIEENVSWQEGFRGSVIWQVPLEDGFSGKANIDATLWDNITYEGKLIRNLRPVQPSPGLIGSDMYFLSNRNFDIQNDTLFQITLHSEGVLNTTISLNSRTLDTPYGVPPNGIQEDDDPNDETDGLQTNDARWLGAVKYKLGGKTVISFVGNTKDFNTGRAGIFHGFLTNPELSESKKVSGTIIGIDTLDFGYPNISYVHNEQLCYEGTIIAFNHTSAIDFAGVSAIYHSPFDGYSEIIRLKEGLNYVRRLAGSYERWGDYFGMQTDWTDPSRIYTAGFYGTAGKSSSTWFTELFNPDSTVLSADFLFETDQLNKCYSMASAKISGGYPPYKVYWGNGIYGNPSELNICNGTEEPPSVTDSRGCVVLGAPIPPKENVSTLYPNPTTDRITINFNLSQSGKGSFQIYNATGQLVVNLGNAKISKGQNSFSFSAGPLQKGVYVLLIKADDGNEILKTSFVKL